MTPDLQPVLDELRLALSKDIGLEPIQDGIWAIDSPFKFPDGDTYTLICANLVDH
jgi:hypothetical protein